MSLSLESPSFATNTMIPKHHTCDGSNLSPGLRWNYPAPNTQSFVLIADDPDAPAGTWVHWVLFNIPADTRELMEGGGTPVGAISGTNSFGKTGYQGPCPPSGTHRYFFTLYALDTQLNLDEHATKNEVISAMQGHIIDQAEIFGTYNRTAGVSE